MSENIKTENLQQADETEENAVITDEISEAADIPEEKSEETASVFSKESENVLGGTEYIGNFDDLLALVENL